MPGGACETSAYLDCTDEPYAGMYYNRTVVDAAVSGEGLRSYWDYWWFYRYNDYTAAPSFPYFDYDHEGDWEGMTVVTEAEHPEQVGAPEVLWVAYAMHERVFRYERDVLGFSGTHPFGYPADGSHATYAHKCASNYLSTCENYAHPRYPDGDHGGERPGTLNSSCWHCVVAFPETAEAFSDPTVWPAEGEAGWNALDVAYGGADTPGTQDRYLQPWSTEPGPALPSNAAMMSAAKTRAKAPATINEADCGSWFGPGVVALVCDAGQMQRALDYNTFGRARGSLTIHAPAGSKVGSTAGLVQVVGRPLRNGDKVELVGKVPARAELRLRVRARGKRIAVARFTGAALRRGRLRVNVAQRGTRALVWLVRADGRVLVPRSLTVPAG
jgi:hypothetical protein